MTPCFSWHKQEAQLDELASQTTTYSTTAPGAPADDATFTFPRFHQVRLDKPMCMMMGSGCRLGARCHDSHLASDYNRKLLTVVEKKQSHNGKIATIVKTVDTFVVRAPWRCLCGHPLGTVALGT